MRISVVIPTYNRCALLQQAIDSILRQTVPACELLVVDDGSTDATPAAINGLGGRVRYMRKQNGGKSSALNAGLAEVRGDAVIAFDDDDLMPARAIEHHARALASNPDADFSYGRFTRFQGDHPAADPAAGDLEAVPSHDRRRLAVRLMENCFLPNPAWAVRVRAARTAGPYREDMGYSQDYDMILRLARNNEGVFIDEPVLFQRKHAGLRGPSHERVYARDTVTEWIAYDRSLMQRLDQDWSLADFRPFERPLSVQGEALAWLQRGVVMFIRKAYEPASLALEAYRTLLGSREPTPAELRIASGLLSCRYGIGDLIDGDGEGHALARRLAGYGWPLGLRGAFCSQLRWRCARALSSGRVGEAAQLVRFGQAAFGIDALLLSAVAKVRRGAREHVA